MTSDLSPRPESFRRTVWQEAETAFANSDLMLPHSTDVLIVGAGITGLTTACKLQSAGLEVTVIDERQAGGGTTGASSAHLTTLPDSGLAKTEKTFSIDANQMIAAAMQRAIAWIEEETRVHNIPCNFKRVSGYLFAEEPDAMQQVASESAAASRAGLDIQAVLDFPLPFPVAAAFRIPGQARFDPAAYLRGVALAFREDGGILLEQTRLLDFHDGHPCSAETTRGRIEAQAIVLATHTPLGRSVLHGVLKPIRSYLIAAEIEDTIPPDLFWDTASPYHYIRRIPRVEQPPLVLLGGADHKTGEPPTGDPYHRLEEWLRARMQVGPVRYRWSAQLYEPVDGFPYIGKPLTDENIFVATGFNGDGLTLGTVAGELLCDLVIGRENELAHVLSPTRLNIKSAGKAVSLNLESLRHMRSGIAAKEPEPEPESAIGWIHPSSKGTVAECQDPSGRPVRLSARCPHFGCVVQWNPLESSWDCPCHGSRFNYQGERLEGPSRDDLKKI